MSAFAGGLAGNGEIKASSTFGVTNSGSNEWGS